MKNVLLLCKGLRSPAFFRLQLFGYIVYKDTSSSLKKLSKNQTKWPIELWTLKQEMETDEKHATMRESFLLVQNILFIEYTDAFSAHV